MHYWLVSGSRLRESDQAKSDYELGFLQRFLKNRLHDIWQGFDIFLKEPTLGRGQLMLQ